MNLRMAIVVSPEQTLTFENPGPVIRIGRDPDCELSLQGAQSTAVSRQHARIDMTAAGATLTDMGSSNGTLLNGKRIDKQVRLCVGDSIQMGYTGATLTVLDLDLSPPRRPTSKAVAIGLVAAIAVAALAVVAAVVLRKEPVPESTPSQVEPVKAIPEGTSSKVEEVTKKADMPITAPATASPTPKAIQVIPPAPVTPTRVSPSPVTGLPPDTTIEDFKEVGTHVVAEHGTSILMARKTDAYPWVVLPADARVTTATTLVSLPGYRSQIVLDNGLQVTLWGNLPEFSAMPPVLESVAMFLAPPPGLDCDLTLDRGRVLIANQKSPPGPARVRLRFLGEAWDLELPEPGAALAAERWTLPRAVSASSDNGSATACLGLFAKGRVDLAVPQRRELSDGSRLSWQSRKPKELYGPTPNALPDWLAKEPDRRAPAVQKAIRSLLAWSDILSARSNGSDKGRESGSATSVVETIRTQVEEVRDPDLQDVGIFFLAAIDETETLISFLRDRQNANVRGVTLYAMQSWLNRGSEHAEELSAILQKRGDSKDQADRIVRLLHFYSKEAVSQRRTCEELVDGLANSDILVRNLAFWHLSELGTSGGLPEEASRIEYDPAWELERRRPGVEQWKKLIAYGKLPVPPRR